MSPSLAEIQCGLAAHVLGERSPKLIGWALVPDGVDPMDRLAVYEDGYPARIFEALAESFPAIAKILGEGSFAALVQRYRPMLPRGWCNLNDIGRALPAFLASDQLTRRLPLLPDLARLEHSVHQAFHADVGPDLDFSPCLTWDLDRWSAARFVFRPDVTWWASEWPVRDLWDARLLERSEIDVALEGRPQTVCVHRTGFDVTVAVIDPPEAALAACLSGGGSFGGAMDELARAGITAEAPAQMLARWIEAGLIAAIL